MSATYATPNTVAEACELLTAPGSHALAGGVAFTMALTKGQVDPASIVSLAHIHELHGVKGEINGALTIGALSTHGQLLRDKRITAHEAQLGEMFADVGNVRVRAVGTLGGNLAYADPRHDPAPLLGALGASVVIESTTARRTVPVADFATGAFATVLHPGELVRSIELPARSAETRIGWCKLQTNSLDDYATLSLAVGFEESNRRVTHPRILVGAADTHVRTQRAAALLDGVELDAVGRLASEVIEEVADVLAADIEPSSNHRGSAAYKRDLVRVALNRALDRTRTHSPQAGTFR
ncbi:MAG: FAD binding domain-containing protein [Arthrobacter sp.]|nr:FAD binding domain-containing protein [Arthrobacter sp.]